MQYRQTYWRVFVNNLKVLCWKPGEYVKKVLFFRKKKFLRTIPLMKKKQFLQECRRFFRLMSQHFFVESREMIKPVYIFRVFSSVFSVGLVECSFGKSADVLFAKIPILWLKIREWQKKVQLFQNSFVCKNLFLWTGQLLFCEKVC